MTERAETWGRASGASFQTDGSASVAVSRLWRKLEQLNLIKRANNGRLVKVTKLLEDGSGTPYTRPRGSDTGPRKDVYFQLPFQYWTEEMHKKLDMPAKIVMLIGMSLRQTNFALSETPTFASWYGISEATLRRGIKKLLEKELLVKVDTETYITGETRTGYGFRTRYTFRPPYDLNVKADREGGDSETPAETLVSPKASL
ncbi:hypothetical protein SAMN05216276_10774 [Streptosporangium subroseum]|uniref:Helix-turn-helix domain-containing protein n=1 Tax=Streptosporangium subroseum TaxID=106412 RepID=A0A239NZN0_9ACTN|nr:hypothetical protein SAMN05216276_10774 [Streptosporangium subroseum]